MAGIPRCGGKTQGNIQRTFLRARRGGADRLWFLRPQRVVKSGMEPMELFAELIAEEARGRRERTSNSKIKHACFPVVKTLDDFDWEAPDKINRELVRYLFHLEFVQKKENVAFIGTPGVGKTQLMTALDHHACRHGHTVRFAQAIDIINRLAEAQTEGTYTEVLKEYTVSDILCIDEIGFLPIDASGVFVYVWQCESLIRVNLLFSGFYSEQLRYIAAFSLLTKEHM